MTTDPIPDAVYRDAAIARARVVYGVEYDSSDPPVQWATRWSTFRAAVESAYRAGRAAGPDGATIDEQWTMRYLLNGKPQHAADDCGHVFDSRETAELHLRVWRETYPTLHYTDVEYLRRRVVSSPWEPVTEEAVVT